MLLQGRHFKGPGYGERMLGLDRRRCAVAGSRVEPIGVHERLLPHLLPGQWASGDQ